MTDYDSITLHGRARNLQGLRFNKLRPIKPIAKTNQGTLWLCLCDCGNTTELTTGKITSGQTKSCGCLWQGDKDHHNMSGTPTHVTWTAMRGRCNRTSNKNYKYHGGRGIKVCKKWEDFSCFFSDMGERPDGTTLDRIDNDGDYTPKNCRWATPMQQGNNKRNNVNVEFDGKCLSLTRWSKITGISHQTMHYRIFKFGWSVEKALTTPPQKQKGRN